MSNKGYKAAEWYLAHTLQVLAGQTDSDSDISTAWQFDPILGSAEVIDILHSEVHAGHLWSFGHYNAVVANGANLDIHILTGARIPHIDFVVSAGGAATVVLYEATTVSGNGTALTVYNHRRSAQVFGPPGLAAWHTPSVTGAGQQCFPTLYLAGGTSPTTRVGGAARQAVELNLLPSARYLLRTNNSSGGNIAIGAMATFYEED